MSTEEGVKSIKTMTEEKDRREEERVNFGDGFNFEGLPTELKQEVLKKLKTGYLLEVCTKVSLDWREIVNDMMERMQSTIGRMIPPYFRNEMAMRVRQNILDDPLEMIKFYENVMMFKKFDVTSVLVNRNVGLNRGGLIYKLREYRQDRECGCEDVSDCTLRILCVIPAFNLFLLDYPQEGLRFFNLADIEKLNVRPDPNEFLHYRCPNVAEWLRNDRVTSSGVSVFGEHILVEEKSKTLLLLKVTSCDHDQRTVNLERVRRIHLPIWSMAFSLYEDRLVVLYTTGYVGMWDRSKDQLEMSPTKCDLGEIDPVFLHRTKVFRLGTLALIRANATGTHDYRWYLVDSNDPTLLIHLVDLFNLVSCLFIQEGSPFSITQVFYIDLWYNCLMIHCRVQSIASPNQYEIRVVFRRIQRYPTVDDFLNPEKFSKEFLYSEEKFVSVVLPKGRYAFTCPFVPVSKPWQLEPPVDEPIPVADLIALQLTPMVPVTRNKLLKVYRMRMANLPFKYKNELAA